MDSDSAHMMAASRFAMLKPENGHTLQKTQVVEGVTTVIPITSIKDRAQRRLEVKARSTLMMCIPNEHQLKFNSIKVAKQLMEATEKRFGGNAAIKKTQRNLLKQQYENFIASNSEMLDQTFNRLQKLISQLELLVNTTQVVNTAIGVSTDGTQVNTDNIDNLSDVVICVFLASQPSSPQLINKDLEQIHPDDLEEMDLKCHKKGHLARECRAPRSQDTKHKESTRRTVHVETPASTTLVSCDGLGGYDWSDQAEEDLKTSELMVLGYKTGLESVEERHKFFKTNESVYLEDIMVLKVEIQMKDIAIKELMRKLELAQKEKDNIQLTVDKLENVSKSLNKLKDGLDEFANKLVVENSEADSSQEKPKEVRKNTDALIIEKWVSDNEDEEIIQPKFEQKIVKTSIAKIEFVKAKQPEKKARKIVKQIKNSGQNTHRPRGNQRNWNNMMSQRLGSNFEMLNKACYVCESFDHLQANCHYHQKLVKNQKMGNPQMDLQDKGVINSGCSRHMTGNMSYLTDYEEIDGGYVAFGGNPKRRKITSKGTIRTGTKDETSGILKSFITRIENLVDHKVKVIRCDNETEFKNREMNQFCEMKGILRQYSVAITPQQNRVTERRNKTLIETAMTMLADSKLPTFFWAEVVNTACYVQNSVLVVKPHNKTPCELFHGRTPTLSFMRPFGCPVTILNTKDHLGKFDGKADEGFFVEYSLNSKAFRVFNSKTMIVEENLHIRFSENTPNVIGSRPDWLFDIDALTRTMNYEPIVTGTQSNSFAGIKVSDNAGQARKETELVKDYILLPLWTADPPFSQDPNSSQNDGFKPSSDDGKKLQEVWTLVDLPNGKRAIGTKWIFRNKKDERGIMIRNKARLVAQRHTQEKGIDYDEVFAPVARIKAIRLFLVYASFKDFVVYQMDVKSVFLYGKIKEEVYVCQPSGIEDPDFPDRVYMVEKELYGLHQAPRAWYLKGHPKLGLWYPKDSPFDLVAYTDSDYAWISLDRKSTTGVLLVILNTAEFLLFVILNTARVDGKEIIITESSVRRDLRLADEDGVDCFPNSTIFENLELIGPKTTKWNEFSSTMASAIICLATNQTFIFSKLIFDSMIRNLDNGSGKFLMYPRVGKGFSGKITNLFLSMLVQNPVGKGSALPTDPQHTPTILESSSSQPQKTQKHRNPKRNNTKTKTTQANEIDCLKRRVKKLEKKQRSITHKLKRLYKVGLTARVESSDDKQILGKDASKQGRIEAIDADTDITLFNDQDDADDAEMFDVNDLHGEEVYVDKDDADKEVHAAGEINAASIATTDSAATTITTKEVTLAKALAKLKASKPKVDDDKEIVELKKLIEVIIDKEEVAINVIPLSVKSPKIVDWKIHKEGKKSYYQIIRADGNSKIYMAFNKMLKEFDKEDLEDLYSLVKAKYGSTRLVEYLDLILWGDLKTMFEPHVKDEVFQMGGLLGLSHLNVVCITDAHIDVNTALIKLVRLVNFKKNILSSYYCQYKEVTDAQVEVTTAQELQENILSVYYC
uniref:Retrovirus-related Pol polyprotein from transposon TNT 1-94 n=1 Tax=Tanacetum cinerariifolium TaxID=118510 RepID=A0A699GZU0_TANCI|nr:retrovirus-related Pol polyprotein from transposon TNT 1-94 [Tanacetum cinerariifolium]